MQLTAEQDGRSVSGPGSHLFELVVLHLIEFYVFTSVHVITVCMTHTTVIYVISHR